MAAGVTAADVLVVGGGAVGLAAAVTLLRADPALRVTVLDRGEAGCGASRWAGAVDVPYCHDEAHRALVEASWAWHGGRRAASYRRPVPVSWWVPEGGEDALRARLLGPVRSAEGDHDWPAPPGVTVLEGPSYVVSGAGFCRALSAEVRASGRGEVREHVPVAAVEDTAGGAVAKCADGTALAAGHVALCAGPWLPGLGGQAGEWAAARGVRTKRVYGLDVEVTRGPRPWRTVGRPDEDVYVFPRPAADGYGLSLRHDVWDVDPDVPGTMADEVLDRGARILDGLLGPGAWAVTGHRVFADTYTSDCIPVVARLGAHVTIATATHGSGIRLAPGLARLVAESVLGASGVRG